MKRECEHKMKTNIKCPKEVVHCTPYIIDPNHTFFLLPKTQQEKERHTKTELLFFNLLKFCIDNDYIEIALNIDMKNMKEYFEFKFLFRQIFHKTNIKCTFYLNKVIEISDTEEINTILSTYHASALAGHSSFEKTKNAIRRYFCWPTMNTDIKQYVKNCDICRKAKITKNTKSPLQITTTAEFPFQKVFIDHVIVEREHVSKYPCILTCICELTKYAIAVRMKGATAEETARKFVKNVILKYGIPTYVVSDQGQAFLSQTFLEITKLFKIKKITTTPYRPNSNIVERFHRTLSQHLITCISKDPNNWHEHLDSAVFAYNNSAHSSTGFTPHELLFGYSIQLPENITGQKQPIYNYENYRDELRSKLHNHWKIAKQNIDESKQKNKRLYDQHINPIQLEIGDSVYVRKPFKAHKYDTPYDGPFTVEKILSPVTIAIKRRNKLIKIHKDKLIKAY